VFEETFKYFLYYHHKILIKTYLSLISVICNEGPTLHTNKSSLIRINSMKRLMRL